MEHSRATGQARHHRGRAQIGYREELTPHKIAGERGIHLARRGLRFDLYILFRTMYPDQGSLLMAPPPLLILCIGGSWTACRFRESMLKLLLRPGR